MKLAVFLASLLTLTFTIPAHNQGHRTPVAVYENGDDLPPCCAGIMEEVRATSTNIWIRRANIGVFIDQSAVDKEKVTAAVFGCYPIGEEKISACKVYVTAKMLGLLDKEKLFATLAHEVAHVAQRGERRWFEKQISLEYEADEFSMLLLKSTGRNPEALIKTLRIILQESSGLSDDDRKMISGRIARAEKILATN